MGINEYLLPGDRVMPEGIVVGPGTDHFFTGSSADGTIYRCALNESTAQIWQPPGADGRDSALGMAIHQRERLLVCGGRTGHLFVYDLATGALVSRQTVSGFLNDVCLIGDTAYVTDSSRPVLWSYRAGGQMIEVPLSPEVGENAYLNGIVPTPSGEALLVAAQGTEILWRVDPETGKAEKLTDGFGADGLLLIGDTIYGLCNEGETMEDAVFFLTGLTLDGLTLDGEPKKLGRFIDPRFDTPTTLDTDGDRLLIVNAQFANGTSASPPFQVIAVGLPVTWR